MYDKKKIVVLGHPRVGKTALTVQLVESRFVDKHDPTIEDCYHTFVGVDDQRTKLEIYDTAGDEQYAHIRSEQLRSGDGFLLVFSLMDRSSFYSIRRYYRDIVEAHKCSKHSLAPGIASTTRNHTEDDRNSHLSSLLTASNQTLHRFSDPPSVDVNATMQRDLQVGIVIVGTEIDRDLTDNRAVSSEEVYALAQELQCNYHEISCRKRTDVVRVFDNIVRRCRDVNAQECVCGAREAAEKRKKHKPCTCQQRCVQCHQKRNLHVRRTGSDGGGSHNFVGDEDNTVDGAQCCAIQ